MEGNKTSESASATPGVGGLGLFLVEVASFLTIDTVWKLANMFNYAPAEIEECQRHKNPGHVFIMSLRAKGVINPYDVSILVDALRDVGLHGIALEVMLSFQKNCMPEKNLDSPSKVKSIGHQSTLDGLFETFKRSLSLSQSMDNMLSNQTDQTTSFIDSIKITYQELYNKVRPIPFLRDRLLRVDKIFIDNGMERLVTMGVNKAWKRLDSYHCLFNDISSAPMRCILFGEPGFGKSTLALQLVYDWCNRCPESHLKNVDILIFLRLRQLRGVSSIMKAIKQSLLPRDSNLSESDIMEIVYGCKSVVILLDGLDEYAHKSGEDDDDVTNIIKGRMFQKFLVIVTTRTSYKPPEMASTTVQVRLTGFDSQAQDDYIRKTVTDNEATAVDKIKKSIADNPIVSDLCEVPLFFAMISHMTYEKKTSVKFESVTSFFRYMIGCFHEHMKIKLGRNELIKYEQIEKNHRNLDKAAFDALTGEKQEIVWMTERLQKLIGKDLYDQCIDNGILVEEETIIYNDVPGSPTSALTERKTQTRFYHKLFCEWYAAHYISNNLLEVFSSTLAKTKTQLDPFELQYVFRFACGINPNVSQRIIEYLQTLEGGDKFAILCILEQTGQVDNILESIRQLCFEGVIISGHDSLLLQRSSLQLLEIAAKHNIPITKVHLNNCLQSVDLSTAAIRITSGLALTSRIEVKVLVVSHHNREMTEDEAIAILEFSSMCPSIRVLRFYGSVPPQSFKVDSTLTKLNSRNIKVTWQLFKGDPDYILNKETGRWENKTNGEELTTEEIKKMRSVFAEQLELRTEDKSRQSVKGIRKAYREKAEKSRKGSSE